MVLLMIAFGFTGGLTSDYGAAFRSQRRVGRACFGGAQPDCQYNIESGDDRSLTLFYLPQILHLMNVPENIWDNAYRFLFVLCSGLVLVVSYNLLSGFIRALGDNKTPLYFLIFQRCSMRC